MLPVDSVVFLLDVDNTLLDNDRFAADLGEHLQLHFGAAARARYFSIFAELRERFGIAATGAQAIGPPTNYINVVYGTRTGG